MKNSNEQVESSWVKIWRQANKGNLMVDVYLRLPNPGELVDEEFLLQLHEASHSQALILLRDFNHPDICQKNDTNCQQSRRFLGVH